MTSHRHSVGYRVSPTYKSWQHMLQRCRNPRHKNWDRYGGRGITVCERWYRFESFLADMGEKPPGLTIDRIDNDGNYEPGNCRWITRQEQNKNRNEPVRPRCGRCGRYVNRVDDGYVCLSGGHGTGWVVEYAEEAAEEDPDDAAQAWLLDVSAQEDD